MAAEHVIRVLIADDHAVVRQGLCRLLASDPTLAVVGEATTGHEVLSLVLQRRPDVLLLDLDLPGQSGLDALRAVQAHAPHPPRTLLLSAFREEEYVRRARELGVAGFLSKECQGEQLRHAIHRVMAGEQVFDGTVAAIMREQGYSSTGRFRRYTDGSRRLSAGELDVLRHMMSEQSYAEIALRLGRRYRTVRAQATAVCLKLGASNRQQAVIKALELGILRLGGEQEEEGRQRR